jgi:hypothetical protein
MLWATAVRAVGGRPDHRPFAEDTMAIRMLPSQEFLRECFDYEPMTGVLRWRQRPLSHFTSQTRRPEDAQRAWNNKMAGKIAGVLVFKTNGHPDHVSVGIYVKLFPVHRVIFKLMTGEEPPPKLDHRDRHPFNNQWKNIRPATNIQNSQNTRVRRNQRTGLKGVWAYGDRYRAVITIRVGEKRDRLGLGIFDTPEAAHAAYVEAARQHFGEFFSPG